jgi:hypothetical protein
VVRGRGNGIDWLMKTMMHGVTVRRRLLCSPAVPNEYLKLELSRVWEPPGNSRPSPFGEGKATQFGFP